MQNKRYRTCGSFSPAQIRSIWVILKDEAKFSDSVYFVYC